MAVFQFDKRKLENHPCVYSVDCWKLELTSEFMVRLYKEWKNNDQSIYVIARILDENGLKRELVGKSYPDSLAQRFRSSGFPVFRLPEKRLCVDYKEENPLLLSGKFIASEKRKGISIEPSFRKKIASVYPDTSVEESLRLAGLDPVDVGYQRIHKIMKDLELEAKRRYLHQPSGEEQHSPEETYECQESSELVKHPYVASADYRGITLTEGFYNEAYLLYPVGLEEIFRIYELDTGCFTQRVLISINSRLYHWTPTAEMDDTSTEQVLRIRTARAEAMNRLIEKQFVETGRRIPEMKGSQKRLVCQWIRELPRDPQGYYTVRKILALMGMKKSTYYEILHNEAYGETERRRADQDEKDLAVIQEVLDYKGFEKGIRQVYMLMPRITGQQFSMYRIRRIMNKYGLRTAIRRPSRNRKAMKELITRNQKANLLMRRFRMYRPNEVRLTDVTYLDYGDGKRAYGSASVDPVTGRLVCFVVSENNDLQLALDTLEAMDSYPAKNRAILHSDQGILYMTDDFQAAVAQRDMEQSMSRRGNCWDNAPQESFHGHFKDECHYKECRTIEELRAMVREYSVYYNNERGMWNRGKMTPAEYEAYLSSMSEEEFRACLAREEQEYLEKKEKAAARAVQESRNYRDAAQKYWKGIDDGQTAGKQE